MRILAEKLKKDLSRIGVPASGHARLSTMHYVALGGQATSRGSWKSATRLAVALLVFAVGLGTALPAAGQITISDDFNDNSLNSNLWVVVPYGQPYTLSETNQQLEMSAGAGATTPSGVGLGLKIPFMPDNLDVQVDYKLLNWIDLPGGDIIATLAMGNVIYPPPPAEPTVDYSIVREDTHYIGMFGTDGTTISTTDMQGRLRIAWSGSTVTLYYWSGGAWQMLKQGNFPNRLDQPVPLALFTGASPGQYAKVAFDNFTVTGTPAVGVLLNNLIQDVRNLNAQRGIRQGFDAKIGAVENALDDWNAKNNVAAVSALHAFMYAAWAQRGKQMSEADADRIISKAQTILVALGG